MNRRNFFRMLAGAAVSIAVGKILPVQSVLSTDSPAKPDLGYYFENSFPLPIPYPGPEPFLLNPGYNIGARGKDTSRWDDPWSA